MYTRPKKLILFQLKQCKYVNPEYAIVFSKIPISSKLIKSNSSAYVYGWGSLNPYRRNIAAEHLQRLKVTIISNNKCRKRFDSVKIQESHMCAISPHGSFAPVSISSVDLRPCMTYPMPTLRTLFFVLRISTLLEVLS